MLRIRRITLLLFCLTLPGATSPPSPDSSRTASPACARFDYVGHWAKGIIRFYQVCITDVDGHQCPMLPTCSRFAHAAIDSLGWWPGMLLTVDRLNRCEHDLKYYRQSRDGEHRGYLDHP